MGHDHNGETDFPRRQAFGRLPGDRPRDDKTGVARQACAIITVDPHWEGPEWPLHMLCTRRPPRRQPARHTHHAHQANLTIQQNVFKPNTIKPLKKLALVRRRCREEQCRVLSKECSRQSHGRNKSKVS